MIKILNLIKDFLNVIFLKFFNNNKKYILVGICELLVLYIKEIVCFKVEF